jgi:aspartyl-tRNA(Asn)/glutamyl-tRNA(Gln) amidotransferase subunit C
MKNSKFQIPNFKLTEKEVEHVAALAKLSLSSQETVKFQKQLSEILEYINLLNVVETDQVEPTNQVTGLENVFREDKTGESFSQAEALSGAKDISQGRFKVKAILGK